jgi:hypothetical protein
MEKQKSQAHQETCDYRSDDRIDNLFMQVISNFGLHAFSF